MCGTELDVDVPDCYEYDASLRERICAWNERSELIRVASDEVVTPRGGLEAPYLDMVDREEQEQQGLVPTLLQSASTFFSTAQSFFHLTSHSASVRRAIPPLSPIATGIRVLRCLKVTYK
jgi:hypothetical protein